MNETPQDNPAVQFLETFFGPGTAEVDVFDFHTHYPEELAVPEVARLHQHYLGVDTYRLHRDSRDIDRHAGKDFVYGDTPVPLAYRLLKKARLGPDEVCVDLGCGCGKVAFTAALLGKRVVGVDLVEGAIRFCQASVPSLGIDNVEFRIQNMLETDLSEANVIFAAVTTFTTWTRAQLKRHLLTAPVGTRVISATHSLEGEGLALVETTPAHFSWSGKGKGHTFRFHFHERV